MAASQSAASSAVLNQVLLSEGSFTKQCMERLPEDGSLDSFTHYFCVESITYNPCMERLSTHLRKKNNCSAFLSEGTMNMN